MYNLLMIGTGFGDEYWEKHHTCNYEIYRVFQYTADDIKQRYQGPDDRPDFDRLKELPCLFTYEGRDVVGTVGYIQSVTRTDEAIDLTYVLLDNCPKIPMNEDEIFHGLGIVEEFERYRTHWAVKNIDLFRFTTRMLYEDSESRRLVSPDEMKNIWGNGYKKGKRIFLSHKATDKERVANIKRSLEQENISCFVAHDDIQPTSQWRDEIIKALETMDVFIGFVTDQFHQGSWTDQEIGYAYKRGIPRIFVELGNTNPQGFVSTEQALKANWNTAAQKIIKHLQD